MAVKEITQTLPPAQRGKMERMRQLIKIIKEESPITYDEILGRLEVNYGLARKKAIEYIEALENSKKIVIEDGIIKVV